MSRFWGGRANEMALILCSSIRRRGVKRKSGGRKRWRVCTRYGCNGDGRSLIVRRGGVKEERRGREAITLPCTDYGKRVHCELKTGT
jgi:hypothetical protein